MNPDIDKQEQEIAALRRLNAALELRVAEQSEALAQAERELQSLSHAISHDLRAPLRTVNGFSNIVLAANAGKLDPESTDNLGRIAAGAQRMGGLIEDLLKLSRISRQALRRQEVDMSQLAAAVAGQLAQASPARQVELLIAQNMKADADRDLCRILLEHLLGNAWKFTSRTAAAKIEVSQPERGGEIIVRDNGAGFEMRYADKLFGAFQRLHTPREFEGNGIGLCIVQRIVTKHGGKVRAEAKPGEGATFCFTLGRGAQGIVAGDG